MGINLATEKFKADVTNLINNSDLPIVNILLVMQSTISELNTIYRQCLEKERGEFEDGITNEAG